MEASPTGGKGVGQDGRTTAEVQAGKDKGLAQQ